MYSTSIRTEIESALQFEIEQLDKSTFNRQSTINILYLSTVALSSISPSAYLNALKLSFQLETL